MQIINYLKQFFVSEMLAVMSTVHFIKQKSELRLKDNLITKLICNNLDSLFESGDSEFCDN